MKLSGKKLVNPVLLDYPVFNLIMQIGSSNHYLQADTEKPERE